MAQFPLKNGLLQGTLDGTPTSGTVDLSSLTLTLPVGTPAMLPGIRLWMDASQLKWQGSAEMADATSLDAWRSISKLSFSSADVAFTAASTARPLYKQNIQNSKAGILFDGSNDLMTGPTDWSNVCSRNEHTVIVVCRPTALVSTGSGVTYSRPQLFASIAGYEGISVSPSGSSNIFTAWAYDSAGARTASTGTLAVGSMALVESWHQDGVLSISLNQAAAVTTTLRETTTSGSTMQMGTSGSVAFFTGYIFEALFFDRALTKQQRTALGNYLRAKWSF
jgi:hypothetical protein